jgi:hypothetical protein
MNHQNIIDDPIFLILEFNDNWIEAGVINEDIFLSLKEEYLKGEDKFSEHYRWGAFKRFLASNHNINTETFHKLYNLGRNDLNYSMGRAMIFDVVNDLDCPMNLIDAAIKEGDFTLSKYASKCKTMRENS